jgi:hypothetical protein
MQGENLLEVGATVPIGSIENAPPDTTMVWPPVPVATIDIPEVARQKSGMTNVTVFWEPYGHPTPTFRTGAQASKFHAEYDAQKQEYRLIFSGFSAGI